MENQELIEKYDKNAEIVMKFLALFNQIDKHFDKVLLSDWYLPYNEKIKRIINGRYYIAWFVRLHQLQLKYFGEIRNQITHGIKLDGHTYIYPSEYAIEQLAKYASSIKKPPRCLDIFSNNVFTCQTNDKLKKILEIMDKNNYSHVPVYNEDEQYMWVLSESEVLAWLTNEEFSRDMKTTTIGDVPLMKNPDYVIFVNKKYNIYEIDRLFTIKKQRKEKLWIVFITENGKRDEKILGVITAGDTALIDTYVIH